MINPVVSRPLPDNTGHYAKWPWGLSFSMIRTPEAEVVWSNRRLPFEGGEQALLDEFAWHVPIDKSQLSVEVRTKIFYAECYGGPGIHFNAGGARCAWSGNWLVKGIGVNLLSGYSDEQVARFRNNGRASLSEILVEVIWGEVLNIALPYGAVRMTAVIRTGETLNGASHPTGALGVREFAWRPASFMRAEQARVRPENRTLIPSDTVRVKEAIARMPQMLPTPAAYSAAVIAEMRPLERLKIGLEEMVKRFAEQMAASKARRLSHGTLTASNFCLDGRWNDLNSPSALPSYGYRRNMAPFWKDHLHLLPKIDLLTFYIAKYFPSASGEPAESMPQAAWLQGVYQRYYEDALARRFVALCGYPQLVADRVWAQSEGQANMRRLAERLIYLARSGHSPRRPYHDAMHETTVSGDYDLPEILRRMTALGDINDADLHLQDAINSVDIRTAFIEDYRAVANLMFDSALQQGLSEAAFARLVSINCHKSGRNIPFLYRNMIFRQCEQLVENYRDIGELRRETEIMIEAVVDESRFIYQEAVGLATLIWCGGEKSLEYDAQAGHLVAESRGVRYPFPCDSSSSTSTLGEDVADVVSAARRYWGDVYEEFVK